MSDKALSWGERKDPEVAGGRWDLPAYRAMEERRIQRAEERAVKRGRGK